MAMKSRPTKRRKTRKDEPIIDGDASASNAVTTDIIQVQTRRGVVSKQVFVPLDTQKRNEMQVPNQGQTRPAPDLQAHGMDDDNVSFEPQPHQNKVHK